MSGNDAFDGEIERLFARPPQLDDGEAFAARVQSRLNSGWRVRVAVLGGAGAVGGFFAVREALDAGLGPGLGQLSRQSSQMSFSAAETDWTSLLDWLAGGGGDLAVGPSMPLFWLVSAGVIGAALFTALKAGQAN